jgi:hypothetical protein
LLEALFSGETVSHALADVLRKEIDLNALPKNTRVLSVGPRKEGEPTYFWEESPRIRRTEVRPTRSRRAIVSFRQACVTLGNQP